MVCAVRRGMSLRAVSRRFRKSVSMVRFWVKRAGHRRLDRVDWSDHPSGNPKPQGTTAVLQRRILYLRTWLRERSALGECGAAAIHRALTAEGLTPPSVRTIARILARHGVVRLARVRRPSPPPGWYLLALAAGQAELDSFDFIEGLAFRGAPHFDALTAISLWGSLAGTWVLREGATTLRVRRSLESHWRQWGLPTYAQFDNDAVFQGSHGHPAHLGRLVHFCLCLGVIPVFTPPREQGFQNKLESYNAYWQQKVWQRRHYHSHAELAHCNATFLVAHLAKHSVRREAAPPRRPFPKSIPHVLRANQVIFLRRADLNGCLALCGKTFRLPRAYAHRLLRCEWQLDPPILRFFALHRRNPSHQPFLRQVRCPLVLTPWFSSRRSR